MSTSKSVIFYELCRLCLENTGVCNVLESNDLLQDIYECTGVKVLPYDNLPHKICDKCSTVVQDAKALRTLATKNDAHLRCLFDVNCCDEICKNDENRNLETILNPEKECRHANGTHSESTINNKEAHNDIKTEEVDIPSEEMVTPIIKQTISLRKDLFYTSSTSPSPTKTSETEESEYYAKLLKKKVKAENQCKKRKSEDDITVEYVCGICSKEFDTQKKFYLHQRLHNKTICCPFDACGKKFATKGDLQKHTRTHTGEKPYECYICGKSFTQKVSLRAHVASVHTRDKEEAVSDGKYTIKARSKPNLTRKHQPASRDTVALTTEIESAESD